MDTSFEFRQLLDIIKTLRSPNGCPWDREQTPETLRSSLLDECLEVIQGINHKDEANVREELGDVLLVVFLMAQIYEERTPGFQTDMIKELNEKLIRRHPHVFGDAEVGSSEEVVRQWEAIKKTEKNRVAPTIADKIPKGLPPLEKSYEIQKKVSKVGFDWETSEPVIHKLLEELEEVKHELKTGHFDNLEQEIGDLLFSAVNLSRVCKVHPSLALERTNTKFLNRFAYIEKKLGEKGLSPSKEHFDQMEELWEESKSPPRPD